MTNDLKTTVKECRSQHGSLDQLSSESGDDYLYKMKASRNGPMDMEQKKNNVFEKTYKNLVRMVRVYNTWTTTYFLPSPFPAQHETKSTPEGCSQGHRAPSPPVQGLQHPLGRGRMPVFPSWPLLPAVEGKFLASVAKRLGSFYRPALLWRRLSLGCGALQILEPHLSLSWPAMQSV